MLQNPIPSISKHTGFAETWNARNCDRLKSKTDRKICLRFRRKQCYVKLETRLKKENRKWSKRKIVFSCKKRQKRNRCINYLLKDKSKQLMNILKRRYQKKNYSNKKLKRIARSMCKKKVNKMKYKYYAQSINQRLKRKSTMF